MNVAEVATALRAEAEQTGERRLLVLAGDRDAGYAAAREALDAGGVERRGTTQVGPRDELGCERVSQRRAGTLLGTTHEAVVFDAHEGLHPNALGRVVGAVDGGGLFVLLAPPLDAWPDRRDEFDATFAVPPFAVEDVTGNFRQRFVALLRTHPGVAVVRVEADAEANVEKTGLTNPSPRLPSRSPKPSNPPGDADFPGAAYEACRTADQREAVRAFESLRSSDTAVVVEADRGRGKSSAAGIAAGALAADGRDVLVTAPEYRSAREVFARAVALLDSLGELDRTDRSPPHRIETRSGGVVRFEKPPAAVEALGEGGKRGDGREESEGHPPVGSAPDVVLVDEAAALPVNLLEQFLGCRRVAFTTTVHGYEGAGRGFSVRFRARLDEADHAVREVGMVEPIRYAAGDPVEVWAFRALALDARPAVEPLVADTTAGDATYRTLDASDLLADENLLREVFGLLVLAHYRTEPADLARLLDAPNLRVRALCWRGHVVSVALLAHEGNLPASLREHMYEGGRVKGNMLPDVLTSQLRDEDAGVPEGLRVMRIATHHAVRSRGLGSRLLREVRGEFAEDVDWFGTGFGATPELLDFWRENDYRAVQLSTTRNDESGEHSALLLSPTSDAGRRLHDRTARRFVGRVASVLSDALADLDPDVVRATLRATDAPVPLDLSDWEWRVVAAGAYGPGHFDQNPGPFRRIAVASLVDRGGSSDGDTAADGSTANDSAIDGARTGDSTFDSEGAGDSASDGAEAGESTAVDSPALTTRQERLLVLKVLQAREWAAVADELGFHSTGQAMRALGEAFRPLVDRYGNEAAREERARYDG